MSKKNIGILEMTICSVLWSIAGLFIGFIPWNPLVISGFRSLLAAATVSVYMLIRKEKPVITKKVCMTAVFLAATFLCFVTANKMTTSANAILLQYTSPVFVLLFSAIFLKQKFRFTDIATTACTMGGILIFFLDSADGGKMIGNLLGVAAGLFIAAMLISVGSCRGAERMSGILFGQLLTAVIGIPFCFFTDFSLSLQSVGAIVILGVFQLGIPYILLALSSAHCPPLAMVVISALEPILNPVWVALFGGVIPGTRSLIGGAVVLISVTVQCLLQNRKPEAAS